ncbi:MAG: hypothetical protein V7L23_30920 [Nostoc sp.]
MRLASLVETLAEPLMEEGFEPLLVYSRGVDSLARSNLGNNVFATLKLKKMLASNTASLALPKSIFDVSSFVLPRSILDTINLALPKSILDVSSFALPKSTLLELHKQIDFISTASDLQIKHELIHKLINLIHSDSALIESAIESDLSDKLSGETVTSHLIPDDNNEGTIDEVGEIEEINLNLNNVEDYDNYFVIPFSLRVDCQVTYFIYKADYYAMEDEDISISDDDWNDHYFWAGQYYLLMVEGLVSVHPKLENINSQTISDDEAYEILEDSQISIDSLTKIEILEND